MKENKEEGRDPREEPSLHEGMPTGSRQTYDKDVIGKQDGQFLKGHPGETQQQACRQERVLSRKRTMEKIVLLNNMEDISPTDKR